MANADQTRMLEGRSQTRLAAPTARRIAPHWMTSERPWVWLLPVVILLLLMGVYPLIYNVWNSFQEFNPMSGRVEPVGWENWQRLWRELTETGGRARASLGITATYAVDRVRPRSGDRCPPQQRRLGSRILAGSDDPAHGCAANRGRGDVQGPGESG